MQIAILTAFLLLASDASRISPQIPQLPVPASEANRHGRRRDEKLSRLWRS